MGATLAVSLWLLAAAAAPAGPSDEDCLACHSDPEARDDATGRSVHVPAEAYAASVHAAVGCATCHEGVTADYPHAKPVAKPDCASCHDDAAADLAQSIHAGAGPDRPTCASCHGTAHGVVSAKDPASPVARKNLPQTCGSCHSDPGFLERHKVAIAHPVEAFQASVHGRAVMDGKEAASCADCHGKHRVLPGKDPESTINHWNVPKTCGTCHTQIQTIFESSVHGDAVRRGVSGAPVCTDCHGEHGILAPREPGSLVHPARVSTVTCGRCHEDERLAAKYSLPKEQVPAFEDSYHGLALRTGSATVANCASCHGVHNILPSSDSKSTVHTSQLATTCGACHPGAGSRFAIGPIHVRPGTQTEHPFVRGVRVAYLVLIPLTIGFMLVHNVADYVAKLARGHHVAASRETVPRMNLHFRVAHWLTMLSFPVLVVTGFALKFPEAWWAAPLLQLEGHLAFRGGLHRVAGVVLLVSLGYHAVHLLLVRRDRGFLRAVWPRIQDLRDMMAALRHNLTGRGARPTFGALSYGEKAEYWAYLWGSGVMAATGLLLWFENWTLAYLPTWIADAATTIHYYEAILATLAIVVWHFYGVIFDPDVYPMDLSWLTGRASASHLRHTRPEHYARLVRRESEGEAGEEPSAPGVKAEAVGDKPETPGGEPGGHG